jgi:hypothetical protein
MNARTGPVRASRKATAGLNSQLALVLDTDAGTVFIKGLPRYGTGGQLASAD